MNAKKQASTQTPSDILTSKKVVLWLAGILLLTYIAYTPSLKNGFTNWDDNVYIGENTLIKDVSGAGVKNMFSLENHVSLNYHPITILSLAIDYKLSEYNPKTYHITNLLFHLLNTALVFFFIFLLSGKRIIVAAIVALFFGVHPMHVESVAWIAERKDVLYTFFFMASLIVYFKYMVANGSIKLLLYGIILILFSLSLLSKAMAVVLPITFMLLDYYKGRKFDKFVLLEKIPFLSLSLLFGLLASNIQSAGAAVAKFETFTVLQRLAFASYGIVNYIYKLIVPTNLSCFYPYPNLVDDHLPIIFYICPFIVLSIVVLVMLSLKKSKDWLFGFLFFCITIVLVLQFISVGQVIMADRYAYIPYIGLLFPLAMRFDWLQQQVDKKYNLHKQGSVLLLIACIVTSMWLTFQRIKVWKNSDTLWTDAISKYPQSESPYRNRASYLINKKAYDLGKKRIGEREIDRALADFTISIKLNPTVAETFTNRANIYGLKGRFDLALSDYSNSIKIDSTDPQTFYNRAITYSMMKQFDNAIKDYDSALLLKPDFTKAKKSRAYSYVDNRNFDKAIAELNSLIAEEPKNAVHYFYRGVASFNLGNSATALSDNTQAILLNPSYGDAYFNRSVINQSLGNYSDALEDAIKARDLGNGVNPNYINGLKKRL